MYYYEGIVTIANHALSFFLSGKFYTVVLTADHILITWKYNPHKPVLCINVVIKNFHQAQLSCIAEIFSGINFCQYSKGHHILYAIINTGQKN